MLGGFGWRLWGGGSPSSHKPVGTREEAAAAAAALDERFMASNAPRSMYLLTQLWDSVSTVRLFSFAL